MQIGLCRQSLLAALLMCVAIASDAAAAPPCPDNGTTLQANCTKEIRIWNDHDNPIYVVLQGSIQKNDARNCTVAEKGGGDVWLQAALGDRSKCYPVNSTYYVFVNPTNGIKKGEFASISLPWWSKRPDGAPDRYVDWWRGGRVIILDDKAALNDSYSILQKNAQVQWASRSPVVTCKAVANNKCNPRDLKIYQATPASIFGAKTPYQLNEFTFASVSKVIENGKGGGEFIDFNQGYNVSNVDQIYLPIAIEPVRKPADVGYMGTTMDVKTFRTTLNRFTDSGKWWPVYNNPLVGGARRYPLAGVRVPSTYIAYNFYMNPAFMSPGVPEIMPLAQPKGMLDLTQQWINCTTGKGVCPESGVYREIDKVFSDSYAFYVKNCNPPAFLKPVPGTNPQRPSWPAYLRYVHGWVPFNSPCSVAPPELPITDNSRTPIDYMKIQYNYETAGLSRAQWFNPYTKLIHDKVTQGGLEANAYAFSIDDQSSFQSNSGGELPGGLIIDVGGSSGLLNKTQVPPPTPPYYPAFDFSVSVGPPSKGGATWKNYGVCSAVADKRLPASGDGAYGFGVDPAIEKISAANPCLITLTDSKDRIYQLKILKADIPPNPIWPPFQPAPPKFVDSAVVSCPTSSDPKFVPPGQWCNFLNEVANPNVKPRQYSISGRGPLP